jgi:hypothetical protein
VRSAGQQGLEQAVLLDLMPVGATLADFWRLAGDLQHAASMPFVH